MASVVLDSSLREYFDDILASQSKGGTPIVVGFVIGAANEQKFQVVRAFKSLKPEAIEVPVDHSLDYGNYYHNMTTF